MTGIRTEDIDGLTNDRRKEMRKYYINWFRYIGLYILSVVLRFHYGFHIDLFIGFLIYLAFILVSVERNPEYHDDNIY